MPPRLTKRRLVLAVLAALVIIGVSVSGWHSQAEKARQAAKARQRSTARAELKNLGGKIETDASQPDKPVVGLDLSGCDISDNDLKKVAKLKRLKKLDLSNTRTTDAGAEHLEGMASLRTLGLRKTLITFPKFKKLKEKLPKAKIDVGLTSAELDREAKQAKAIYEIKQLGGSVELATNDPGKPVIAVDLSSTGISDKDLSRLQAFPRLQKLQLGGTHVTDDGLTRLKGFASLETLLLGGTLVTDAGLQHIDTMKSLKHIFLVETRVTPQGVNQLHEKLPGLHVERW